MKKILLASVGLFAFVACNNPKTNTPEQTTEQTSTEQVVGGDKDEHGCLASAGQTWSEIKQNCIQVFAVGERLNPIEVKEGEAVLSAFVVFNDDKSKAELFLAEDKQNHILDKTEGDLYQDATYKYDAKDAALYINGVKKYMK